MELYDERAKNKHEGKHEWNKKGKIRHKPKLVK